MRHSGATPENYRALLSLCTTPRGTYRSSPVHCFESDEEEAAFWDDAAVRRRMPRLRRSSFGSAISPERCGEVMGPLLSHISTTDTVRDLDRMRELLGEDEITCMGLSYGTLIGQVYANMFPEHLRAMLLDGVVAPVTRTRTAWATDSKPASLWSTG